MSFYLILTAIAVPILLENFSSSTQFGQVELAVRVNMFTHSFKNFQLPVEPMKYDLKLKTDRQCASFCARTPKCLSFNICVHGCFLNSVDIWNPGHVDRVTLDLVYHKYCSYVGMQKHYYPSCIENGKNQSIIDDLNAGNCQINLKRTDCVYGRRLLLMDAIEDPGEFQNGLFVLEYENIYRAHGGLQCGPDFYLLLLWVKYNDTLLVNNTIEAEQHCATEYGGILFGNIVGDRTDLGRSILEDNENMTTFTSVKYDSEIGNFTYSPKEGETEIISLVNSTKNEIDLQSGECICLRNRNETAIAFSCPCDGPVLRRFLCDLNPERIRSHVPRKDLFSHR